jgi:4-amino-4-deoxy-L-arabinose transferase-like glycosyltransferase
MGERRSLGWPVWAIAGAHLLVLLAVAGRYGFHRDELYFLEAAQHLALGYVDQPPLVVVVARVQVALLGDSVAALRVAPALASAGSVLLGAALARELGGDGRARTLAAGVVAGGGFALAAGHLLSTSTFDLTAWFAIIVLAARLVRTGDPRWWVVIGAVVGLAMWNKYLVVLLAVSLVAGLAAGRRWDLLAPRWLAAAGAVALVLAAPVLWWQAVYGWPQLEMAASLSQRLAGENRVMLLPLQALLVGPILLPLAVAGVRWLVRGDGRDFRPLLWAYVAALVLTFASGGRPYYPIPLGVVLVIAGAVVVARRGLRWPAWLVGASAVVTLPLSLPLLPVDVLAATPIGDINDTQVEQLGWPELVDQLAGVVASLPAAERDEVVVLAGTYGEAGAVDRYGPALGLPAAYSGHNSYWGWRLPTEDDATVVAVRMRTDLLDRLFQDCREAGRVDLGLGIENEVEGQPIHVCRELRGGWSEVWPLVRHVN